MNEAAPFIGYVYPNEGFIQWSVLIVIYPYLTGLVAGAFTVSSFYHVFGMQQFKPVARLALLTSLCVMVFVPLPLLMHLGHPERSYYSMITPHLTSAFAMFGFFAAFYMLLLTLECWFVFRKDNVIRAMNSTGIKRAFYRAVSLWSDDISPRALKIDAKWLLTLAIVGIPSAHGLHGYIGFVYGSLKARYWWESDLMPVIFLFSAIVSGVALLMVIYVLACKVRRVPIDHPCLRGMMMALWGFLMFTVILEALAFANLVYKGREGVEVIMEYVSGPLFFRYFVLQFGIGALLPVGLMGLMVMLNTRGRAFVIGATTSALLVLMNVLMMRWNVVIGGQEIGKSAKGLLTYEMPLMGHESLFTATLLTLAPFALLWILVRLFPPWADPPAGT
jgi:Ni/Fe-hydrogenase subunit HybB-like protein